MFNHKLYILKFKSLVVNFLVIFLILISIPLGVLFIFLENNREIVLLEYNLFSSFFVIFSLVALLDFLRIIFFLTVRIIRISVLKFSETYIKEDPYFFRFKFLLITFIFSIYFLILSPNLVRILLG